MIFIAKNEDGEPTWKLAKEGKKTVTRRIKPLPVGKEFTIQPGRGKFAVCRAKVISCVSSWEHWHIGLNNTTKDIYQSNEARLEGFNTWDGFISFFEKKKIPFNHTQRIEFKIL